jgi:hypothetical protein
MSTAFLLRFREVCLETNARGMIRGTGTETKIQKEQPDHIFGATAAGTKTITEVRREATDLDRAASRPFFVVP